MFTVAEAPQRVLAQRIEQHLGELFVVVEKPDVPDNSNAGERRQRHLVTCQKISGGMRRSRGRRR